MHPVPPSRRFPGGSSVTVASSGLLEVYAKLTTSPCTDAMKMDYSWRSATIDSALLNQ